MSLNLEDDHYCYVCGKDNPLGMKLQFEHVSKGLLRSEVIFNKEHQGFKGIVHGGMLAMVLDEMMVNLAWKEGIAAVTGELKVRLKKAAKIGQKICFEGRLEKQEGKLLRMSAVAKGDKGELLAEAKATCIVIRKA